MSEIVFFETEAEIQRQANMFDDPVLQKIFIDHHREMIKIAQESLNAFIADRNKGA